MLCWYSDVCNFIQEDGVATDVKFGHGTLPVLNLQHVGSAHQAYIMLIVTFN